MKPKRSPFGFFLRRLISGAFDIQDADECVDTFHGRDFQGRPLLVEFAKENRRREPNMDRSYVAVFKAAVGDSPHRDADDCYSSCLAVAVHLESNFS